MPKRAMSVALLSLLSLLVFLFAACSPSRVGTIPSGTPDHGDGTPSVISTAPVQPTVSAAPSGTMGTSYAFVRQNQLWIATNNAQPEKVTNFNYNTLPIVSWHTPLWSPGDAYMAVIMNAQVAGLGGGGCPGPDYGANGALYVMNVATHQFTQVKLSSITPNVQMSGTPATDYWQYAFWEDNTHLLLWYNGVPGASVDRTRGGLYRYDVSSQKLTQVVSLDGLGVATLYSPQKDLPLLLSLRYSNEQLFYQAIVHPFGQQSQLAIYRRPVNGVATQSSKVLQQGIESWCGTPQGPYVRPGWDVASDGQQVVAQVISTGSGNQGVATIQALNLNDYSSTTLFSSAPVGLAENDVTLTWGPDSQTVVMSTAQIGAMTQGGPLTATLANPAATQQYSPGAMGQIVWRPDGTAFALEDTDTIDVTSTTNVYVFLTGQSQGRLLLTNAHDFAWG